MKNGLILIVTVALYTFCSAQNNDTMIREKPFTWEQDLNIDREIILRTKEGILKKEPLETIVYNTNNSNLAIKLNAINQLGYVANVDGVMVLENILLNDSNADCRIASARSLGVIRSKNSIPNLILALADSIQLVKIYSAIALSYLGEKKECFNFFASLYEQPNNLPFYSCHIAFLNIATSDVKPFLLKDLDNSDLFISVDAAITLAQLGYKLEVFNVLKSFLQSPDVYIRLSALRGLAYLGDHDSLDLIKLSMADTNVLVRERAQKILWTFNN